MAADHAKSFLQIFTLFILGFVLFSLRSGAIQASEAVSRSSFDAIRSKLPNKFNLVSKRLKQFNSRPPAPKPRVPIHFRMIQPSPPPPPRTSAPLPAPPTPEIPPTPAEPPSAEPLFEQPPPPQPPMLI